MITKTASGAEVHHLEPEPASVGEARRLACGVASRHLDEKQFKAFEQDAIDNKAFLAQGKLTMPVLALGGLKSFGEMMPVVMRAAADRVESAVIPSSGHWLMKENPAATIDAIVRFLQ